MYKIDRAFMDGNPRYISTRIGFGEGLVQAGEKDNNVVALCADLTESIQMQDFKNKFGNRFIEVGVAEQNLVTVLVVWLVLVKYLLLLVMLLLALVATGNKLEPRYA